MKNAKILIIPLIILSIILGSAAVIKVTGLWAKTENVYTKLRIFNDILSFIRDEYIEEKDPVELVENAIDGMLKELDPHSIYLRPEPTENMKDRFQGYGGIGISFNVIKGKITIITVMDHGPSRKAGLLRGDRIIGINGEDAIGITTEEVPLKLKGPPGTSVEVTVEREGWDKPKDFTLVREKIIVESVYYYFMFDEQTGYIGITQFYQNTGKELEAALRELEDQGMKFLILDLRGNSGGLLSAAVESADKFIPGKKIIVYTKGREDNKNAFQEYHSTDRNTHVLIPMVVLIDEYSASASEILSGAIQDWDRGLLVGKTSFGKGLVQTPKNFVDGSSLLLTTAKYYTPSGRLIQREYEGKSRSEYYHDAIRNSKNPMNVQNDSLIFHTNAGRVVYGGGGITPDIIIDIKIDSAANKFLGQLIPPNSENPFFFFTDRYAEMHSDLRNDEDYFINYYDIPESLLSEFKEYLYESGINYLNEEFEKHKEYIKFFIKRELAFQLFDRQVSKRISLQKDNQLQEALLNFHKAEQLLNQNYSNYLQK